MKTYYIHPVAKSLVARSKTAAVPLPDPTVSRRHGTIGFYGGKYFYQSTAEAGSYYKLGKNKKVELSLGMTLEIGDNEFEIIDMRPS